MARITIIMLADVQHVCTSLHEHLMDGIRCAQAMGFTGEFSSLPCGGLGLQTLPGYAFAPAELKVIDMVKYPEISLNMYVMESVSGEYRGIMVEAS